MTSRWRTPTCVKTIRMEEVNWPDVREAIAAGFRTAMFAVGSTEQHGPHLPTTTDSRLGGVRGIGRRVRKPRQRERDFDHDGAGTHARCEGALRARYVGPLGEREVRIVFEKGMPALTQNGVLGDPRKASAEKGKVYLEKLAEFLVEKLP